jgi:hypothetical protein|tara:strand:+ start:97 stop:267 length:171 start_codon:yes stop_codon:yes gene_type:complete
MGTVEIVLAALEAMKLISLTIEAATVGDKAKALEYLAAVKGRVESAETAWEDSKDD